MRKRDPNPKILANLALLAANAIIIFALLLPLAIPKLPLWCGVVIAIVAYDREE